MNTKVRNFYLFIFVLILFESIEQKQTFRSRETEANTRLLARVSGEIDAGNFSYYELNQKGYFKLVLISVEGDADIYVSTSNKFADYSNCDLQSTTYGVEELVIDRNMIRPIYISIFAHPYYAKTVYILEQYNIPRNDFFFTNPNDYEMSYDDYIKTNYPNEYSSENENEYEKIQDNSYKTTNQDAATDKKESILLFIVGKLIELVIEIIL